MAYDSYASINYLEEMIMNANSTFYIDFVILGEDGNLIELTGKKLEWALSPYGRTDFNVIQKTEEPYSSGGLTYGGGISNYDLYTKRVTLYPEDTENLSGKFIQQITLLEPDRIRYSFLSESSNILNYSILSKNVPSGSSEIESVNVGTSATEYLIRQFVTYPGDPGSTSFKAGNWTWNTYGLTSNTSGNTYFVYKLYKRSISGTETLIYSLRSSNLSDTLSMVSNGYNLASDYPLTSSDRIVTKIYAVSDTVPCTVDFYFDGDTPSHLVSSDGEEYTPFKIGRGTLLISPSIVKP